MQAKEKDWAKFASIILLSNFIFSPLKNNIGTKCHLFKLTNLRFVCPMVALYTDEGNMTSIKLD
jgi:hypothetical protein